MASCHRLLRGCRSYQLIVSRQLPLRSTATSRLYRPCRSPLSLHCYWLLRAHPHLPPSSCFGATSIPLPNKGEEGKACGAMPLKGGSAASRAILEICPPSTPYT